MTARPIAETRSSDSESTSDFPTDEKDRLMDGPWANDSHSKGTSRAGWWVGFPRIISDVFADLFLKNMKNLPETLLGAWILSQHTSSHQPGKRCSKSFTFFRFGGALWSSLRAVGALELVRMQVARAHVRYPERIRGDDEVVAPSDLVEKIHHHFLDNLPLG